MTPLAFTKVLNNGYELTKASALYILGGVFSVASVIYLLNRLKKLKSNEQLLLIDKNIDPAVVLFIIAMLVSAVFSIKPYVSFYGEQERQIGFFIYLYAFIVYFFVSQIVEDFSKTAVILKVMEAVALLVSFYIILQVFNLDPFGAPVRHSRANATLGNPVFAGGFLILVYPFVFAGVFKSGNKTYRILSAVIIAAGIFGTQTRTAYVAFFLETLIILILFQKAFRKEKGYDRKLLKYSFVVLGFVAASAVFAVILAPANVYVHRIAAIFEIQSSTRWLLWRDSFKVFWRYPVTGSGISTFLNAFENVITFELRSMEVNSHYDNAHSNFLQFLCTTGILGFTAYILIIIQSLRASFKGIMLKTLDIERRLFFVSAFALLCGYIVYGLADFDDITIILFTFTCFALIKVNYANCGGGVITVNTQKYINSKALIYILAFAVVVYMLCNFYWSYNNIRADALYRQGEEQFYNSDFKEFVRFTDEAIELNPGNAYYRFNLAYNVYEYCVGNRSLSAGSKAGLLKQAEEELDRSAAHVKSDLESKSVRVLIYYESGRKEEADKLKDEVFKTDSVMISFRNNLAYYYMQTGDFEDMDNQLKVINSFDPLSLTQVYTEINYYIKSGRLEDAKNLCYSVLKADPANKRILQLLNEIKKKEKGSP